MKDSIPDLIEVARQYFPEGHWPEGYEASIEYRRRAEAHLQASKEYGRWRAMVRRLSERFSNVEIRNESIRFEATASAPVDRCFAGAIELPPRTIHEQNHSLGFRVSFVVPYYFVYSSHQMTGTSDFDFRTRFDFTADEADFVTAIEEEIKGTFPLHTKMEPNLGMVIVPNVATTLRPSNLDNLAGVLLRTSRGWSRKLRVPQPDAEDLVQDALVLLLELVVTAWCTFVCVDGGVVVGSVAYVVTRLVDFKLPLLP